MTAQREAIALERGALLLAEDGPVGRVVHLVIDEKRGETIGLIITHAGREWLLAISDITAVAADRAVLHSRWDAYQSVARFPHSAFRAARSEGASAWGAQTTAVKIAKQVVERPATVTVTVHEEQLNVERRPGDGRIFVDGRELVEGQTVELSVMRDRVRLVKEPVVREAVTLYKEVLEYTEEPGGT
jgi:uncharacterized protein (TIGR02271 family)